MVKLEIVHPSIVPRLWSKLLPMVQSICDSTNGRMYPEHVLEFIREQYILLWCAYDEDIQAIALTELKDYRGKKLMTILGVSGRNKKAWEGYMPILEDYALKAGCDGIESIARKGWSKLLEPQGFKQTHVFIEKMFAKDT